VAGSEAAFSCRTDQRVLEAMAGTFFGGPGCRRGGCGVCRVRVLDGIFDTGPMSAVHVSADDREAGVALACCIYPRSDLVLQAAPKRSSTTKDATRP
jgi:ferredoxin